MGTPTVATVVQFKDAIYLLAQQLESRVRQHVMVDTDFRGITKFYDQYATDSMIELSSRYQDTPIQLPDHRRRAVFPRYFVSSTLEDPVDALQMIIDPKSAYMQAKQAAASRQLDDLVIAAALGTAYTGQTGTTSTTLASFNSSSQIIVNGSTGMTKAKCISAKRALDQQEVDKEDRFMLHTAAQLEDLLLTTEVTSSDYNVVKTLVEGQVNTWLGFHWVHSERLTQDTGATYRKCIAWQKKGLQLAIQKEIEGRVDERTDKNMAWQVYLRMCMGATRLEESRIVEIDCVEASA